MNMWSIHPAPPQADADGCWKQLSPTVKEKNERYSWRKGRMWSGKAERAKKKKKDYSDFLLYHFPPKCLH